MLSRFNNLSEPIGTFHEYESDLGEGVQISRETRLQKRVADLGKKAEFYVNTNTRSEELKEVYDECGEVIGETLHPYRSLNADLKECAVKVLRIQSGIMTIVNERASKGPTDDITRAIEKHYEVVVHEFEEELSDGVDIPRYLRDKTSDFILELNRLMNLAVKRAEY